MEIQLQMGMKSQPVTCISLVLTVIYSICPHGHVILAQPLLQAKCVEARSSNQLSQQHLLLLISILIVTPQRVELIVLHTLYCKK